MQDTLRVINSLESEGIIGKYAIGGATGVVFYAEPVLTYDLDIFCYLPHTDGGLINLGPVYSYLLKMGYEAKGEQIIIEGIPVQFLEPGTALVKEALENAVEKDFNSTFTRVFSYEYLLAIMLETGRPKDKARLTLVLESAKPDEKKLNEILKRHNLLDKWVILTS
jgi:hypothetical protein